MILCDSAPRERDTLRATTCEAALGNMVSILYNLIVVLIGLHQIASADAGTNSIYTTSEYEQNALTEFRTLSEHLAYREFMKSDGYLIRWLKDTDFHVPEALEKFSNFVDWRKQNHVDAVVLEDFSTIDEELQNVFEGFDKEGHAVFLAPFGRYNIRKITISGQGERYQRFMIRMYELAEIYLHLQRTMMNHPNATQLVTIYDLYGWSIKLGGCIKCLALAPEAATNFLRYPRMIHKTIMVNTPRIFDTPLKILRSVMPEKHQEALIVYGYDRTEWLAALHAEIDIDQLPADYGGTKPSFHTTSARTAQMKLLTELQAWGRESFHREMESEHKDDDNEGAHFVVHQPCINLTIHVHKPPDPETEKPEPQYHARTSQLHQHRRNRNHPHIQAKLSRTVNSGSCLARGSELPAISIFCLMLLLL